uniref:ANTXR like n=1 Tax=Sus scrofa TaxID=9823 RepID=A0A5G2QY22_PIG
MGRGGLVMPGPTLFLLLVLPPPLLSAGSFQHSGPDWKDLHRLTRDWGNLYRHLIQNEGTFQHLRGPAIWLQENKEKDKDSCQSTYDLYFILDMSGSINNNWMDIYALVEDLVKKFDNPKIRMSFITYSTQGHILMKLTSDKKEIQDGLNRLQNVVPTGNTYMQEGFKKANEQIEQANSGENKVPSMIIALTDGTLESISLQETKQQADRARKLGANVYCIGVKDYETEQLSEIADSSDHVFGVDQGFKALKNIIDPMRGKTALNEYELMISGRGFNNAKSKDEVICRFIFSDKKSIDKKAASVDDTTITCPGVRIEKPDEEVFIEVSLNNGINFICNNVSIISKNCMSSKVSEPDTEVITTLQTTQQPTTQASSSPLPPTSPQFIPYVNSSYFFMIIPGLLLFLLMLWCIWWMCCKKTVKELPPVQKSEREPEEVCHMQTCPTVIVPCGCQGGGIKRMEGKLDSLCDFVQRCNQMPLMWYTPRDMGRCVNFSLMKPYCGQLPCSPKICLHPSRECFRINSYCSRCQHPPTTCSRLPSRVLPHISPNSRSLCGATLSLQPP